MGTREAVLAAIGLNIKNIIGKNDNFIHHEQDSPAKKRTSNLVEHIRYLTSKIKNINFLYCNRTCNILANRKARKPHINHCKEI